MKKEQDLKPRRAALARGAAAALACMLVVAAWAANRSATHNSAHKTRSTTGGAGVSPATNEYVGGRDARPTTASAAASARVTAGTPGPTQPAGAAAWRYDVVVERNLFMPPAPRQPQELPELPPLEPMPVDAFTAREIGEPEAEPPQWTYAGYATADGTPLAIVENTGTKRAEFLRVGQTLEGFVVSDVTPQTVQLTRDGETTELRISEAFTATPLNEPPRPRESARGQGAWGPGGFPGGGAAGAEFFQRVLPALRDNPDLADRARRFMPFFVRPDQLGDLQELAPPDERQPEGELP